MGRRVSRTSHFCKLCGRDITSHGCGMPVSEQKALAKRVDDLIVGRDAWRAYALHLAHCRTCGTQTVHCAEGQASRDAAIES